ncbi:MAG: AEC family transporter [Defluviitaleaceae bacterium]|nr:AEC family transporter [Defluviitaleaceae bacterium]
MFGHFIFSINTVVPLFLLIGLGFFLRRTEFLPKQFFAAGNRMVFYILLPISLFDSIFNADLSQLASFGFAAFSVGATFISFLAAWAISLFIVKEKDVRGAFTQGAFRSNAVFVGLPLMRNLAGDEGIAVFALVVALSVPVVNICSIFVLSVYADKKVKLLQVLISIVKNPLMIGMFFGFVFSLFNINLPYVFGRTLSDLSRMSTPMALLCLGGGITILGFDKKIKYAVVATIIKIIVLPIVFTTVAYLLGFRGIELAAFMVLGGLPSAISGYSTVVEMGGDSYTASNIVLISTLFSSVTLTLFIYVMMVMGLMF